MKGIEELDAQEQAAARRLDDRDVVALCGTPKSHTFDLIIFERHQLHGQHGHILRTFKGLHLAESHCEHRLKVLLCEKCQP